MGDIPKVLLLDIQEIYRLGIENVISRHPMFSIVGSENTFERAYDVMHHDRPSIVLMDLNFEGASFESIKKIKFDFPAIKPVILSNKKSTHYFLNCFKAGAKGFISKRVSCLKLPQIIQNIHEGNCYAEPTIASKVVVDQFSFSEENHSSLLSCLTPREKQVLLGVVNSKTNKEIALQLQIKERTVKYYMTNIMQKLQVKNRLEAAIAYKNNQYENLTSHYQ